MKDYNPLVTVAIANYNGSQYIKESIKSAQKQSLQDIEIIIVDDASTDDSVSLIEDLAKTDHRIRLERNRINLGPAGSRNRAVELARGDWIAVLDADDLMHPYRLSELTKLAESDGADIVADDLLLFSDHPTKSNGRFLIGERARRPTWITLDAYLSETLLLRSKANLGYLKPVIRRQAWRKTSVMYDAALRIGEDDDLICRLLAEGLKYRLSPTPRYFYRRHSNSISHRLSIQDVERMAAQEASLRNALAERATSAPEGLNRRRDAIADARGFVKLVDAIKARNARDVLLTICRRPTSALLFRIPISDRLKKLAMKTGSGTSITDRNTRSICVISRQRIVGRVSGSSTYFLDIMRCLVGAGWQVHLIQPSPSVMGRWSLMKLKPEMAIFNSIRIRGCIQIGRYVLALDPKTHFSALTAILSQITKRMGISLFAAQDRPAPYAIAAPFQIADYLYVAKHAPPYGDRLLLDYMFQVDAAPYVLRPNSPSAILMHDRFSAQREPFGDAPTSGSVVTISPAEELNMLRLADAVLAIQPDEANWVADNLNDVRVLDVPHSVDPMEEATVGSDHRVLFVGSNAAPNIIGLNWFLAEIWPKIIDQRPDSILLVAGSVARSVHTDIKSVRMLGVVDDLSALYREAGVVISPLTTGTGLKIKLIEGLSHGKAMVTTSVTLQGVTSKVQPAVAVADDPHLFAQHVIDLLGDAAARQALATKALQTARQHFAPEACYSSLLAWMEAGR